jgi:hypothetical protein
MNEDQKDLDQKGDEVVKQVGKLTGLAEKLKKDQEDCKVSQEEVGSWVTTIGKALISIFIK